MIRSFLVLCLAIVALPIAAAVAPAPPTTAQAAANAAAATAQAQNQAAINTAGELAALRQENARLKDEVDRLSMDARTTPAIDRENQQLRERIITMEADKTRLTHENQSLSSWRDGLKAGAGIFILGLVIGVLMSRFRRRAGWSDI